MGYIEDRECSCSGEVRVTISVGLKSIEDILLELREKGIPAMYCNTFYVDKGRLEVWSDVNKDSVLFMWDGE